MYKTVVYFLSVLLSNFNNFFKKNHVWEARLFVLVISCIMGYLFGSFIIEFLNVSAIL